MQKWHICSATLHHDKSCFEFVYYFKRKLSYSLIHFDSLIVSKKYSSDVFVHKKFQSIQLQENYVFQKKARKSPSEMQIFSSQQLFWMQSPQGIRKATFVLTHQYAKFYLFFRTWVNCTLTFEWETFTVDTDFFKKDHLFTTNGFFPFLKRSRDSENQGSFEKENYGCFSGCFKT